MKLHFVRAPFPHIKVTEFVPPELYRQMHFPDVAPGVMGRIGRDLYRGEPGWAETIRQPGWNRFYAQFSSLEFVKTVLDLFRVPMNRAGCLVDVDQIRLEEINETRKQVQSPVLSMDYDPNALFTRFDLQATDAGYKSYVHVDWPRRIVGGVLFMCSAEDEGIEGGEFALFSDQAFRNDRRCHKPKVEASYPIEHNTGYLFLNFNAGFHGPMPIKRAAGLRKWVYYSISSRRNVWPFEAAGADPARLPISS